MKPKWTFFFRAPSQFCFVVYICNRILLAQIAKEKISKWFLNVNLQKLSIEHYRNVTLMSEPVSCTLNPTTNDYQITALCLPTVLHFLWKKSVCKMYNNDIIVVNPDKKKTIIFNYIRWNNNIITAEFRYAKSIYECRVIYAHGKRVGYVQVILSSWIIITI